jgi:hypothetical protein
LFVIVRASSPHPSSRKEVGAAVVVRALSPLDVVNPPPRLPRSFFCTMFPSPPPRHCSPMALLKEAAWHVSHRRRHHHCHCPLSAPINPSVAPPLVIVVVGCAGHFHRHSFAAHLHRSHNFLIVMTASSMSAWEAEASSTSSREMGVANIVKDGGGGAAMEAAAQQGGRWHSDGRGGGGTAVAMAVAALRWQWRHSSRHHLVVVLSLLSCHQRLVVHHQRWGPLLHSIPLFPPRRSCLSFCCRLLHCQLMEKGGGREGARWKERCIIVVACNSSDFLLLARLPQWGDTN